MLSKRSQHDGELFASWLDDLLLVRIIYPQLNESNIATSLFHVCRAIEHARCPPTPKTLFCRWSIEKINGVGCAVSNPPPMFSEMQPLIPEMPSMFSEMQPMISEMPPMISKVRPTSIEHKLCCSKPARRFQTLSVRNQNPTEVSMFFQNTTSFFKI